MKLDYLKLENIGQYVYIFCLEVGNKSRINRHVPVIKARIKIDKFKEISLVTEKRVIPLLTRNGKCEIYTTLEEAQTNYEETKQRAITTFLKDIDKINHLIERIRKL